ncbi:TPA: hypothetical protein ACH3X1_008366 [Trebouxia sp. C0004]
MLFAAEQKSVSQQDWHFGCTSFIVIAFVSNWTVGVYRTAIKAKQGINVQRPILVYVSNSPHKHASLASSACLHSSRHCLRNSSKNATATLLLPLQNAASQLQSQMVLSRL